MIEFGSTKFTGQQLAAWTFTWFLLSIAAYFSIRLLAPLPIKAVLMIQTSSLLGLGYLFFPGWDNTRMVRLSAVIWSLFLALATLLIALFDRIGMIAAGKAALAVLLLSLFMQSLTYAIAASRLDTRWLAWLFLCGTLLLTTMPIWISPWIETIADNPQRLNMLLWCSPLSYLAAMLDYDFLRSEWFYRHTLYGMLRYDYPDTCRSSFGLLGISLILFRVVKLSPYSFHKNSLT